MANNTLKTGQTGSLGETLLVVIRDDMGYEGMALQNKSGHGLDWTGIKRDPQGRPICICCDEVKSSTKENYGKLSPKQKNPTNYVREILTEISTQGTLRRQPMTQAQIQFASKLLHLMDNLNVVAVYYVFDIHDVGNPSGWKVSLRKFGRVKNISMSQQKMAKPQRKRGSRRRVR